MTWDQGHLGTLCAHVKELCANVNPLLGSFLEGSVLWEEGIDEQKSGVNLLPSLPNFAYLTLDD